MKANAGDESRDQMKCQESQDSKEIGVRGQHEQGSSQPEEGSSTPALKLLEAEEKESVKDNLESFTGYGCFTERGTSWSQSGTPQTREYDAQRRDVTAWLRKRQ